jgi:hypothetical protein
MRIAKGLPGETRLTLTEYGGNVPGLARRSAYTGDSRLPD